MLILLMASTIIPGSGLQIEKQVSVQSTEDETEDNEDEENEEYCKESMNLLSTNTMENSCVTPEATLNIFGNSELGKENDGEMIPNIAKENTIRIAENGYVEIPYTRKPAISSTSSNSIAKFDSESFEKAKNLINAFPNNKLNSTGSFDSQDASVASVKDELNEWKGESLTSFITSQDYYQNSQSEANLVKTFSSETFSTQNQMLNKAKSSLNNIFPQKDDQSKIQLSEQQLNQIDLLLSCIEDKEERKEVQNILDQIISEDGIFDVEKAEQIAKQYLDDAYDSDLPFLAMSNGEGYSYTATPGVGSLSSSSSSTTYYPGSMGDKKKHFWRAWTSITKWQVTGFNVKASANRMGGGIAASADAWIGAGFSQAAQEVSFYVGESKPITVEAVMDTWDGAYHLFGAAAGVHAFRYTNGAGQVMFDINPPFGFDDIITYAIDIIAAAGVVVGGAVGALITIFNTGWDAYWIADLLASETKSRLHTVTWSFTANPGMNTVSAGIKSQATGALLGYGSSVCAGQMKSITIDGIAPPDTTSASITGDDCVKPDESNDYTFSITDPNGDDVSYYIDWGDKSNSGWSSFYPSGTSATFSHTYDAGGTYKIRIKARDKDDMYSDWAEETFEVEVDGSPPVTDHDFYDGDPHWRSGNYMPENVIVGITASDPNFNGTYYRVWYEGSWDPQPGTGIGENNNYYKTENTFLGLQLPNEGEYKIEYYAEDKAGNQSRKSSMGNYRTSLC